MRERPHRGTGEVVRHLVDAAISPVRREGVVAWIDLDLDLDLDPAVPEVEDEDRFHARAREMGHPLEICRGAWFGLRDAAARHACGEWPFDGSLEALLDPVAGAGIARVIPSRCFLTPAGGNTEPVTFPRREVP